MKISERLKEGEIDAKGVIKELLARIPAIEVDHIEHEHPISSSRRVDLYVRLHVSGHPHALVIEVKRSGQPRFARMAALQLRDYLANFGAEATPVFIAPYVSEASRRVCDEYGIGFIDLIGNAHIQFGSVYIDRTVAEKPESERRFFRSLFSPRASRILRVMLRDPRLKWRVTELAEAASVSLGHASNVRKALVNRGWAGEFPDGAALTDPNSLLDTWRENYSRPLGQRTAFYTHLHGEVLEHAMQSALHTEYHGGKAILGSFSAARWLAPYGRTSTHYFYADELGAERLQRALQLSSVQKGTNIIIHVMKDDGVFLDAIKPAPNIVCTSKVQTYLDLSTAGDRGREAADYLRKELLQWPQ